MSLLLMLSENIFIERYSPLYLYTRHDGNTNESEFWGGICTRGGRAAEEEACDSCLERGEIFG